MDQLQRCASPCAHVQLQRAARVANRSVIHGHRRTSVNSQTLSRTPPTWPVFVCVRSALHPVASSPPLPPQCSPEPVEHAERPRAIGAGTEIFKVVAASGHAGVRLRIVGVDPGVRNVYVAYTSDGRVLRMGLGEYTSLAKAVAYDQRLAAVLKDANLPRLPAVRSPHVADVIAYASAVAAGFERLQRVYGDRRLRQARLTVRRSPSGPSEGGDGGRGWRAGMEGGDGGRGWRARMEGGDGGRGWRAGMEGRTRPVSRLSLSQYPKPTSSIVRLDWSSPDLVPSPRQPDGSTHTPLRLANART